MKTFVVVLLALIVVVVAQAPWNPTKCISELTNTPVFFDDLVDSDCHVFVFGDFHSIGGDDQGRLCVQHNANISPNGFSIGQSIRAYGNGSDNPTDYSLVVGYDLVWTQGSLDPPEENMFVGGTVTAPAYLKNRWLGGPCASPGRLDIAFAGAQKYYINLSETWAAQTPNVFIILKFGTVLFISGFDDSLDRYYIQISATIFNQVNSYVLENVNTDAEFIITITGTQDVVFGGGFFPCPPRHLAYNIPGSRNVYPNTGVGGSIVGPNAVFNQTNGVVTGYMICGSVVQFHQENKLDCGGCICN